MIGLIGHHGPRAVMACSVARPRRERETELHAKLRRDALLIPRAVLHRHLRDESLDISGNTRAPAMTGLAAPEEAKEISMPPHERVGPHNRQELTPSDQLREQGECDARGVVRAARPDLAFDVTGKLLPEKQVLGGQLRSGPDHQPRQVRQVSEEGECRSEQCGDDTVCNQVAIDLRGGVRAMEFLFAEHASG